MIEEEAAGCTFVTCVYLLRRSLFSIPLGVIGRLHSVIGDLSRQIPNYDYKTRNTETKYYSKATIFTNWFRC